MKRILHSHFISEELRFLEKKAWFAQGHIAGKWWSRLAPNPVLFALYLLALPTSIFPLVCLSLFWL